METYQKANMTRFRNILVLVSLSTAICQQLIHNSQNKGCHVYKVTTNVIVDPEMCLKNINKISTTQCVQKCSEMEKVILKSTKIPFEFGVLIC